MQPYILNSFRRSSDGAIFTRVETGTNSGGYVSNTTTPEVKRLRDFICDGSFTIHSVVRNGLTINVIFTVGDRLSVEYGGSDRIASIKIINSEVLLYTGITDITRVDIRAAGRWVQPTTASTPQVERRGPGRPSNAELAARNTATATITNALAAFETLLLSRNTRPVRLEKTLIKTVRKLSLQDFLIKFFKEWNAEKTTIYVDDKVVQTGVGRRRSLGDIYLICKYYYPECTLNQVLNLLYNVLPTLITDGFRTSYCSTIHKQVWYYASRQSNMTRGTNNDEYGKSISFYTTNITT